MLRLTMYVRIISVIASVTCSAVAAEVACPAGDNSVIQACIDAAQPGDVLVFSGNYSIDPEQPYVRIENKGDLTLIGDEASPPVFSCGIGANGRPLPRTDRSNDGINVQSDKGVVSNLVFEGLRFVGCATGIQITADCQGSFSDVELRRLAISNAYYGVILGGDVDDVRIRDSSIVDADIGIYVTDDGTDRARRIDISGNEVIGLSPDLVAYKQEAGIFVEGANGRITDNRVSDVLRTGDDGVPGIGIIALNFNPTTTVSISGNVTDRNAIGISLGGTATAQGRVAGNRVESSTLFGIVLRAGANGWNVGPNHFRDNPIDVNLTSVDSQPPLDGANDNDIRLLCGQTYADGGVGNRIRFEHR